MNTSILVWLFFRGLRWAASLYFLGFSLYFWLDRAPHLNSFGHLQIITEVKMFAPVMVAIFAACMEMMMREKLGLARPAFGQLLPARAAGEALKERAYRSVGCFWHEADEN